MTVTASRSNRASALSATVTNRVTLRKTAISCFLLFAALLLGILLMSLVGSERLPARASLCALLTLGKAECGLTVDQFEILFQIRLPRLLLAAAVGSSLATAGASYQALLRNPLAEAYLLGISNGAASAPWWLWCFLEPTNGAALYWLLPVP